MMTRTSAKHILSLLSLLFLSAGLTNALSSTSRAAEGSSRREVLQTAAALPFVLSDPASAATGKYDAPVAVLGASGRTGALCVASLLRRGLPAKALTRSGAWPPPKIDLKAVGYEGDVSPSNPLLTVEACDVKSNVDALAESLSGCRAVIYAASASRRGGNAEEIDGDGVVAAGEACVRGKVGRYVVLSSGSTTRPNSAGYRFTEMAVANIMTSKRRGEVGVREAYSRLGNKSYSTYTIVRPGGLDEPKQNVVRGPSALEIAQGDVLAGFVSRADVAEVAVELALSASPSTRNTALELYYRNKVVPVDAAYRKYLNPDSGLERLHGDSYDELFRGVKADFDYLVDA
ncbi:hypothetical protein ACHAWF_002482 [Thalassiosira exigua]